MDVVGKAMRRHETVVSAGKMLSLATLRQRCKGHCSGTHLARQHCIGCAVDTAGGKCSLFGPNMFGALKELEESSTGGKTMKWSQRGGSEGKHIDRGAGNPRPRLATRRTRV